MKKLLVTVAVCLWPFIASATGTSEHTDPYSEAEMVCLAKNIYYEARGEGFEGQEAVAWVTINRSEDRQYPTNLCKVVYSDDQFSWTANPYPIVEKEAWAYAQEVAKYVAMQKAQGGLDPTFGSLMFHAKRSSPYWTVAYVKTVSLGNHIFYRQ